MIIELMDDKDTKNFLVSYERMVQATFPEFKLDPEVLKLQDIDGLPIEKLTNNLFEYNFVNQMILCKNYLKTIDFNYKNEYPEGSIESQLGVYQAMLSDEYTYFQPVVEGDMRIIANYLFKDGEIPNEWIEQTENIIGR